MTTKFLIAVSLAFMAQTAFSAPDTAVSGVDPTSSTGEPSATAGQEQQNNQPVNEDPLETIRKNVQARLGATIKQVKPAPVKGLYEIVVGNEVIYADESGEYVIMGEMFNTLTRQNLTEIAKNRLMQIDFDKDLPLGDAIKTVYGDGSRKIAVFSDPNCTFCRRLETTLRDLKDVTIYTFLYPVITPTSRDISANIWCSNNKSAVWLDHMLNGKTAPARDPACDVSVLDRNIELGRKLGVNGTPLTFFEDGNRAPGAISTEYIERRMQTQQQ